MLSNCATHDACATIVEHLPVKDALPLSGASRTLRDLCMDVLSKAAARELDGADDGAQPWRSPERVARLSAAVRQVCVRAALQPRCLLRGCQRSWPNATMPLPFTVETAGGALCFEFKVVVAKAFNGGPRVGLVDAGAPCVRRWQGQGGGPGRWWPGDLSRGSAGSGVFAVSFDASCGLLAATGAVTKGQQRAPESAWTACANVRKQGYYAARLNWADLGGCNRQWHEPYHIALVLEQGSLTFYRHVANGLWQSSGPLLDKLPREVLPCVFMSSFCGHAQVEFVRLWKAPPDVCKGCDAMGHGFVGGSPQ